LTTFRIVDAVARCGSIRAAAERLSQTPSAVQRRVQAYEDDLGVQVFERSATGVRPTAAGELVIQHVRDMLADTDRLQSRIADLAGMRRGRVTIGCSQALTPFFLPRAIADYQAQHPAVTFDVRVLEHGAAASALENYVVDLVLVFIERGTPDYEVRLALPQPLVAIMRRDHPLAARQTVRLRDCFRYPVAAPQRGFGGRMLMERSLLGKSYATPPILESNSFEYLKAHVATSDAITFQVRIGAPRDDEGLQVVSREIDTRDVAPGVLFLGQKRGRILPVATSRFMEGLLRRLVEIDPDSAPSSD
jgi:DNA-binding transcriptional LysR family regulator